MVFCKFQNTASKKWYLHFFTGKLFQNNLNNIATPKTQAQAKIRNSGGGFSIFCLWWETACLTRQYFLSLALEGSNAKSHIRQDICLSTKSLPHSSMQTGCISILNFLPSGRKELWKVINTTGRAPCKLSYVLQPLQSTCLFWVLFSCPSINCHYK